MQRAAGLVTYEEGSHTQIEDFAWVLFDNVEVGNGADGGPRACLMHHDIEVLRLDPHRVECHFHIDPMNQNASHKRLLYHPAPNETPLDSQLRQIGNHRVVNSWLREGGFENLARAYTEEVASSSQTLLATHFGEK